jgi:ABC-type bacteriocin/lantibiotic exporter with double-glycine peptidase domain
MSTELPHYTQEKPNTCALACLRMVLAAYGTRVNESELEALVQMEPKGTPVDELERLARQFGLIAEIQDLTVAGLQQVLEEGKLPIAFLDRAVFELTPTERRHHSIREAIIHNAIPVKITAKSVALHDPRFPQVTRRTLRLFRLAYERLGGVSVVCSKAVQL